LANANLYTEGLSRIVAGNSQNQVVACVAPNDSCWERFLSVEVDVLLVHEAAVQSPTSAFLRRFREARPHVRIIVFGQDMDKERRYHMVRSGAHGYICTEMTAADVLQALHEVMGGRLWVERDILEEFVYQTTALEERLEDVVGERIAELGNMLTRREKDVLPFALQGMATKEIAEALGLSEQSVKLHLGHIFRKFDVASRSQLLFALFQRVCPVSNMIKLFRMTLDRERIKRGKHPIIPDPLD